MIPQSRLTGRPTRTLGTDSPSIRCDRCSRMTYVSAAATNEEEIRAIAAKSGWSTEAHGAKTHDICPEHHQLKEES